ncbi:MAG: ASPIC/UnbV domain-containing protein, partial [Bacteroidota bacterium]
ITNKDFIDFSEQSTMFGTKGSQIRRVSEALREVDGVHQPNFLFQNQGDLGFRTTDWLPSTSTYSNGSVLVDLDGDGDLDLVTNNNNEPAGILHNTLRERQPDSSNYFQLDLEGTASNPDALGAKVWITVGGQTQYHEHYRQRGYLSTTDQTIHFGLGKATTIDELLIRFPDGRGVRRTNVPGSQRMSVVWNSALDLFPAPAFAQREALYSPKTLAGPVHQESAWSDFNVSALALRDHSRNGPAMTAIDVDGDGIDELVFGGAAGEPVTLWKQDEGARSTGSVEPLTQVQSIEDSRAKEVTALAVLPTNDAPVECLYIAAGSTEAGSNRDLLFDLQAYAHAERPGDSVPLIADTTAPPINVSTVVSNQRRGDDLWVFLGNRMSTKDYLAADASVVLRPDRNEAALLRPAERLALGMVSAAAAADFDGNGLVDLATAGDYVDVQIVTATEDGFATPAPILNTAGWNYSLTATALDGDGDVDLLLGNAGLNIPYRASPEKPLVLLADDYDDNGTVDPVITAYNGNKAHPVFPRNTLTRQLPAWKKMLRTYALYGAWTASDLPPMSATGTRLEAVEFRSLFLENDGRGNFTARPLPALGQTAPIRDALEIELPDGRPALLCVQNDYATEPLGGRFDAGTGFALAITAAGELEVLTEAVSLPVDARSIVRLRDGTKYGRILVGVNDGTVVELVRN